MGISDEPTRRMTPGNIDVLEKKSGASTLETNNLVVSFLGRLQEECHDDERIIKRLTHDLLSVIPRIDFANAQVMYGDLTDGRREGKSPFLTAFFQGVPTHLVSSLRLVVRRMLEEQFPGLKDSTRKHIEV